MLVLASFFGGRLAFGLLRQISRRNTTTFDDAFIHARRAQARWIFLVASFQIAILRLGLLRYAWR
jgi:hypothetical protein